MPSSRTYTTAGAFRRALEERLKRASLTDQIDLNRLRRQVSFDRLLARLFREEPAPWVLKGGYALELRFKAARSTVDIDLTLQRVVAATSAGGDTNQVVREMLQSVADIPLGDWFEYAIGPPVMDLAAAPYGGARYHVVARMDERIFARFHLDAGVGDAIMQPLETIECRDWLGFAGIERPRVQMIACEQQFAEKIHVSFARIPSDSKLLIFQDDQGTIAEPCWHRPYTVSDCYSCFSAVIERWLSKILHCANNWRSTNARTNARGWLVETAGSGSCSLEFGRAGGEP